MFSRSSALQVIISLARLRERLRDVNLTFERPVQYPNVLNVIVGCDHCVDVADEVVGVLEVRRGHGQETSASDATTVALGTHLI